MKHEITYWSGDRELPTILILIGPDIEVARFYANIGLQLHDADKAIIKDVEQRVIETVYPKISND